MADYTVAFSELDALLNSLPANSVSNPYSINVTGLTESDIDSSELSGTLGYVLLNNASKFVDLSETVLPEVTNMGQCFSRCMSLTIAPVIPNSVTNMVSCFSRCINLTTAPVIPNSVTNMGSCFFNCSSLTTAPVIPNSVINMSICFSGCTSLIEVPVIPNSVTDMSGCFVGCTSLTTAPVIPYSVTNMEECFFGCTSLIEVPILVPSGNLNTNSCFNNTTQTISVKTQYKNSLKAKLSTPFPNNVTIQQELNWEVPFDNLDGFLSGCLQSSSSVYELNVTGLQESDIGSAYSGGTLGYVIANNNGVYADYSETILPNSVTIMPECFIGCTSLIAAPNIPNSVTYMGYCFQDCTSLTTAPVIPNSVTDMGFCFQDCTSLTTAPNIPNSVTYMDNCFSGCTSLIEAPVIPNSVTNMESCFYGCTSLTTAPNIPNSVSSMVDCFNGCTNLTTIDIFQADTVFCYMGDCFSGCTSLSYIGVPETLPNATKWQFVHAVEDSDGITMTIETDDTEPVEVETSEHTYGILGLICDMLFSEDAFDLTRMSNYLASRMPWIVESPTSLDANEDWTVLWAKDPHKVKSNFIPTIDDTAPSADKVYSSSKIDSVYASFDAVHPVGEVYVQFPMQLSPQQLYNRGTWTDITSTYAGLFFRSEGGNAKTFTHPFACTVSGVTVTFTSPPIESGTVYENNKPTTTQLSVGDILVGGGEYKRVTAISSSGGTIQSVTVESAFSSSITTVLIGQSDENKSHRHSVTSSGAHGHSTDGMKSRKSGWFDVGRGASENIQVDGTVFTQRTTVKASPADWISGSYVTGINMNIDHTHDIPSSGAHTHTTENSGSVETRVQNCTIRLWKRTA